MCFPIWREDESCPTKPNPQMQPHLVPLSLRHGRAQRRPPPAAALTLSLHPAVPAIGFTFTAPPSLRAHLVSPAAATDAALNTMAFPGAFVRASRSGEKTSRAQPNPTRRCSRISFPSPSDTAAPTGSLSPPLPLPSPYPGPTSSRRGHGVPGSRGVSPWMGRRSESSMDGRADGDLADAGKNRRCHPSMADTQLLKVHPVSAPKEMLPLSKRPARASLSRLRTPCLNGCVEQYMCTTEPAVCGVRGGFFFHPSNLVHPVSVAKEMLPLWTSRLLWPPTYLVLKGCKRTFQK
ncbi:uncharacterized protein [Triticum aestivum]|uniref:uncharacterized protein isoform X3 n=1 Tax=Triticum aestivum TaxID=4565 RepID=UPI001D001E5A|nr:uncharacterized protein LOC123175848 isoform X3 [Triticum aestivum]